MSNEAGKPITPFPASRVRRSDASRNSPVCDYANASTEVLLYFMIVFGPWAFGTTQVWSIWTMNVCGYILGGLLAVKWLFRTKVNIARQSRFAPENAKGLTRTLAVLTVMILGYCLCAAVNARAKYDSGRLTFDYYTNFVAWLPHSYDRERSFDLFWNY